VGIEEECVHQIGCNAGLASGESRRIVSFNVGTGWKFKWQQLRSHFGLLMKERLWYQGF
jgi:hypothetical protein